jgi:hypothetical protein
MLRVRIGVASEGVPEHDVLLRDLSPLVAPIVGQVEAALRGKSYPRFLDDIPNGALNLPQDSSYAYGDVSNRDVIGLVSRASREGLGLPVRLRRFCEYVDVRPGKYDPSNSDVQVFIEPDVSLVQAFGRNTIPDKRLGALGDRAAVLSNEQMFEELKDQNFDEGGPNDSLARITGDHLYEKGRDVIA